MKTKDAWQETDAKVVFERAKWMVDASCVDHPQKALFFTDHRGKSEEYKTVRKICSDCPVWKDCLKYALTEHMLYGFWGGLSGRERKGLRDLSKVRHCNRCGFLRVISDKMAVICDACSKVKKREVSIERRRPRS